MKDDSGRLVWLWGPLLLVAVLVAIFRFAETGGGDSASPAPRGAASDAAPAVHPPGAASAWGAGAGAGGEVRGPDRASGAFPGVPANPCAPGPASYPVAPGCPPWTAYRWAQPFPRPGDHSGRYWGGGAVEWGPPIGEYGPDTQVDPYWWVAPEEDGR